MKDISVVLLNWILWPVVNVIELGEAKVMLGNIKLIEPVRSNVAKIVETAYSLRDFFNSPFSFLV